MEKLKTNFVIFIIIFFSALMFSCGDETTTPSLNEFTDSCGGVNNKTKQWNGPDFGGYTPHTYTLGNERYFNFYIEVDSICTDVHINNHFTATAVNDPGRPMKFRAAVEWLIFFERSDTGSISISGGYRTWTADIDDVGLKQAFGERAGSVFINVYINFPSLGSEALDRTFLSEKLQLTTAACRYSYHKPPTSNLINNSNYKDVSVIFETYEDKMVFLVKSDVF